jgi:3-deoxy-7-phosphoheptulonate synthase
MLLELNQHTFFEAKQSLIQKLQKMAFHVKEISHDKLMITHGIDSLVEPKALEQFPEVKKVSPIKARFKLASRECKPDNTVISIKDVEIGGDTLFICAGPCSIESKEQIEACAREAKLRGAQALRGGAFKPRTSPYEFQGMGEEGLKLLKEAAQKYDLVIISEVMDISQIPIAIKYVDILQVGSRNMQNFPLLKELGKLKHPILLKRGFAATYQEFLMAAEYILSEGNPHVILCERGIRTFETHTRNTLDLNAVPSLKELTHLPILVDPSHGTGKRSLVTPMARAAVASGADGLIIEMHEKPEHAISDAQQTLNFTEFTQLIKEIQLIDKAMKSF